MNIATNLLPSHPSAIKPTPSPQSFSLPSLLKEKRKREKKKNSRPGYLAAE